MMAPTPIAVVVGGGMRGLVKGRWLAVWGTLAALYALARLDLGWALARLSNVVDRAVGWHRLPTPLGVIVLIGNRILLRRRNLHDTSSLPSTAPPMPATPPPGRLTARSPDGTYNDLDRPAMGAAEARFGRNVPLDLVYPEPRPEILSPDPRVVSRELLTRDRFQAATTLNLFAAAWLQFMVRDWLSHGKSPKEDPWELPLADDDPWPERPMRILRTRPDPTRPPGDRGGPPTYLNAETHWWDASQLYGSGAEGQRVVRSFQDGKLRVTPDGSIPPPLLDAASQVPGWWLGLALLYTLFTREHNAICDRLRAAHPGWSDDDLFERARLVNAALMAKIHTVEWTPALISHPTTQFAMRGNWWGLEGERLHRLFGRLSDSEEIGGIPGSSTDHHGASYAITEEFVAVYRMHPLIPDDFTFRAAATDGIVHACTFREVAGPHAQTVMGRLPFADLVYSFGRLHPGAITLHNYPRFLQSFERPDGIVVDLAATDVLRTRELGVPRYNQFRRLFHLKPIERFEDLTDDPEWVEQLRRVYDGDVERLDLMIGLFAERLPPGFAFSDTAFRVFILMASRRLKSDRFFTRDYTPEVYSQAGLDWIADNTFSTVLLRHCPDLAPALRGLANPFAPWNATPA
jgi:hypothetical protein